MDIPNTYTSKNETGCCSVPNVEEWNEKMITLENKTFIRMYTRSFFFIPLNMGKIMTALQQTASKAGATMPPEQAMILSRDLSPWKAEQLYAVSRPIEGADNISLSGTYITKVFEGPYQDAKKWYDAMHILAKSKGNQDAKIYFFYTTCPKCAQHYGKNYTIGLAQVS